MADILDWEDILKSHVIFRELEAEEISALLHPDSSVERVFAPTEVILREGETGDALYLLGEGEASVLVIGSDSARFTVARLGRGDVFGEMSFFDAKPRAATIIADSRCVAREIRAEGFRRLLYAHPNVEFKLTSMVSERLRRVTEGVLQHQLRELDDRFCLLNAKIEAELKVFDSAVRTTQALFDATNERVKELSERASDVIETVNKNQERTARGVKWASGIGSMVLVVAGAFGLKSAADFYENFSYVNQAAVTTKQRLAELEDFKSRLDNIRFFEPKYISHAADNIFFNELDAVRRDGSGVREAAETFYNIVIYEDEETVEQFLLQIMNRMINDRTARRQLKPVIAHNIGHLPIVYRFLSYYLLLSAYHLDGDERQFESLLQTLDRDLGRYPDVTLPISFRRKFRPEEFEDALYGDIVSTKMERIEESADRKRVIQQIKDESRDLARARTLKIREIWGRLPG